MWKKLWCKIAHRKHMVKRNAFFRNGKVSYMTCNKCDRWWWL